MSTKAYEERLAKVSDPTFDSVDLFHASHDRWPLSASASGSQGPIHISVFDSSYNPPTKAHLAISLTTFPGKWHDPSHVEIKQSPQDQADAYTTRLLLLSARNVDKTLKSGDASLAQRIEMMHLQSLDMQERLARQPADSVAVAALNHPTFVGKSSIILRWLKQQRLPQLGLQSGSQPAIKLTFLIGSDTLTRLFMPKYYLATPSTPSGDQSEKASTPEENMRAELGRLFVQNDSYIVSTPRYSSSKSRDEELSFIRSTEECRRRLQAGQIRFVKDSEWGGEEMDMSSTAVRKAVAAGDHDDLDRLCGRRVRDYIVDQGLYKAEDA